jgi:multidrug resistance efflux pump
MPSPFSRTFRSLEAESEGRSRAVLVGAGVILAVWTAWFLLARLSVYVASDTAQIEVMRAIHPVDAPVSGRVVEMSVTLDQQVRAGDVLVVLDSEAERLRLAEAKAREEGIAPQLDATRATLDAEARALGDLLQQSRASIEEGMARVRDAQAAATLADGEARRLEGLRARGAASEIEALRARATADQKDAQLAGLRADVSRLQHELDTNRDDRRTRVAGLERESSKLNADLASIRANIETIQYDIDRRTIRASADGKVGEIGSVRMGSVLREGDRIATIVSPGKLRVIAQFPPAAAFGRVKEGQTARVRLEGFPWTAFGDVTAQVSDVASEVRDNHARVELVILEHSPLIPLQHGMPGSVEIEVEKASPLRLVLQAAGQLVARTTQQQAPSTTDPSAQAGAR